MSLHRIPAPCIQGELLKVSILPLPVLPESSSHVTGMPDEKPKPWNDTSAMVVALEVRRMAKLPLWSVYSYDHEDQYSAKLEWYACQLQELTVRGAILDVGCGSGELLRWYRPRAGYLGLDIAPGLIEEARSAHPDQMFDCGDVRSASLDPFDTVVMIGLLGLSPDPGELIERACALTQRQLLFDFLEPRAGHLNEAIALRYLSSRSVAGDLHDNGLQIAQTARVGANVRIVARREIGGEA
jgi:SAM-dependent methyltransferase